MRFVRFIEKTAEASGTGQEARWGLLASGHVRQLAQAPYLEAAGGAPAAQPEGGVWALDDVRLLAPAQPSKLVCVGRNYAAHAAELGNETPEEPLIFLKPPSCIIGPDEPIVLPAISERVDHEGELAVVIGRRCRNLGAGEAKGVIFGYTAANDVTARDLQKRDGQWTRGKGFDTFGPIGPWIDSEFDPTACTVRCLVNGEERQRGETELLVHPIERILIYVTRFMTLEPGDVILTGTPAGVGPLRSGDEVVVEIDGLGRLRNPVIDEESAAGQAARAE